jgi:hypothetical protein
VYQNKPPNIAASNLWKLDASTNPMGIKHEYVVIGGDLVIASLLSQIVYWHRPGKNGKSKLRVERKGHAWIAKTRKEWMAECHLTRKHYLRAVAVLKDKGLIEVRVMSFAGKAMSHTRLFMDALATELQTLWSKSNSPESMPNVPKGDHPSSLNGIPASSFLGTTRPSESPQQGQPYTDTTFSETTAEITNSSDALHVARNESNKTPLRTVREERKINSKIPAQENSTITKSLVQSWLVLVPAVPGGFKAPLTHKEQGQLKCFALAVGEIAGEVLAYTITNWWHFAHEARAIAGDATCPTQPHIGYLLKYKRIAANLYLQSVAPPTSPTEEKPSQETAEISEVDKPYTPTPDELAITMAKFQ